ncbi:MAG: hypothetical protein WDN28_03120 [Chthoniobacter sp.]
MVFRRADVRAAQAAAHHATHVLLRFEQQDCGARAGCGYGGSDAGGSSAIDDDISLGVRVTARRRTPCGAEAEDQR